MRSTSLVRSRAVHLVLLLAATAGACDKNGKAAPQSVKTDLGESPFLSLVPADTPYVMATFKPVPASYMSKFSSLFEVMKAELLRTPDAPGAAVMLALAEEMGPNFDARRAEELGLSPRARMAFYGLGLYPVLRLEIADGDRLLGTIERIAGRAKLPLVRPAEREGRRYWVISGPGAPVVVLAIVPRSFVAAVVPAAEVDHLLPQILGMEMPAPSLPAQVLPDLARRHGFTAYGVGYLDTRRLAALAVPRTASAACRTAVAAIASRAPRIAWGYGDLSAPVVEAGAIVEFAPDLVTDIKGIAVSTPGGSVVTSDALFAISFAADIATLRSLGGRLADVLAATGVSCENPRLGEMAGGLRKAATAPLPPAATRIRGAILSVNEILVERGAPPTSVDGFAAIWADDAPALVGMLILVVPQLAALDLRPDGQPREISPGALPFPVHAMLRATGVAVWAGAGGATGAQEALAGEAAPAPLLRFYYNYVRLSEFFATLSRQTGALMGEFAKIFTAVTMDFIADDRGLVMWLKMQMR